MDQQAIFIDAGFLLAVGGMQTAGTSLRSASIVNFEPLIEGILKCTEDFSGLPTLRTYWYDASRDALFTDQHKRIGMISGVKVRLGRMSVDGVQKGVDLKLGLDLVGVARNKAASTVFLLSGDDDLAEAVEAAQDFGVKVVLVGLEYTSHRRRGDLGRGTLGVAGGQHHHVAGGAGGEVLHKAGEGGSVGAGHFVCPGGVARAAFGASVACRGDRGHCLG